VLKLRLFKFFTLLIISISCIPAELNAQTQVVNTPRVSPKATITQYIGITEISISYSRPAVRGREIWGSVVPFGMTNPGWGTATLAPWRAGADENTIITFSTDVKINGVLVSAGTYALFMAIYETGDVDILLSNNTSSWGSYFYKESEVVSRIKTTWEEHSFREHLEYTFSAFTPNSVYCALNWEEKSIPFEIEVDLAKTVVDQLRKDLQGTARFSYLGPMEAASWCVLHNTNLNEALEWADLAVNMNPQFSTLMVKAEVLKALNKPAEAKNTLDMAIPKGSVFEIHSYGRSLISEGKVNEALDIFERNAALHKDKWPVNYGLARGYSAKGDYKKAIVYLEKAKKNCPDEINRKMIDENLAKLVRNEDIN
jgi:tetratricopeptide (TPR) repeat protein